MPIVAKGTGSSKSEAEILNDIYQLRKRIFIERLAWDLPSVGKQEIDQFDNEQAHYGALYEDDKLQGCFRLIRMDQPNMCSTVFRPMFEGYIPATPDMVESSRLCFSPEFTVQNRRAIFQAIKRVVELIGEVATQMGGRYVYSLSDIRFAKLLITAGVPIQRTIDNFEIDGRPCAIGRWDPKAQIMRVMRSADAYSQASRKVA